MKEQVLGHNRVDSAAFTAGPAVASTGQVQVSVPKAAAKCEWTKHTDPASGDDYYHNTTTGETTWDQPPGYFSNTNE